MEWTFCVELGCGAEFLYSDGRDGQFLACDLGEEVEAVASKHAEPEGELDWFCSDAVGISCI